MAEQTECKHKKLKPMMVLDEGVVKNIRLDALSWCFIGISNMEQVYETSLFQTFF